MKSASSSLVFGSSILLLVASAACGDSGGTGGSGNGSGTGASSTGAGTSDGGNGNGGDGAGVEGGGGATTNNGGGGDGGGPAACPSEIENLPPGECDLYLQNCPVATDTCEIGDADPENPAFEPIPICITKNGLKAIGESCNTTEDCEMHITCVGGICTPFCCPEDPDSCGGGDCNINVTLIDAEKMDTGFFFTGCSFAASCDLFSPDSCPPGDNCYPTNPGQTACYTPTLPRGSELADGAACVALNDCQDSSSCVGNDDDGYFCHYLCETGSADPAGLGGCPAGQLCDTNAIDFGFANVGFCHP